MSEERVMDTWGRLEVEWRNALEAALNRQREFDGQMTNHLVYHLAGPDVQKLEALSELWHTVHEARRAADAFIRQHAGRDAAGSAAVEE